MMQTLRQVTPLPTVLKPLAGESFVSFIDRNVRLQEVSMIGFLHRIGLADEERITSVPNGYGIHIEPSRKVLVARALHLSENELNRLLLEGFAGISFDAIRDSKGTFDSVRTTQSSWLYLSGSHVCPGCVRSEYGYWHVAWKLPWSFLCLEHKRLLECECPQCKLRFASWRRDRQVRPRFPHVVPAAGICVNSLGGSVRGRQTGMCGFDITGLPVVAVQEGTGLIRAQVWLNDALERDYAELAGEPVKPLDFFRIVRGTVALLMYAGVADDVLGRVGQGAPGIVGQRVQEWFSARDDRMAELQARAADRIKAGQRQGIPPQKLTSFPPTDSALMAGLLTAAHSYLEGGSVSELAINMQPLLKRGVARSGVGSSFIDRLGLPPAFIQMYSLAFSGTRDYMHSPATLSTSGRLTYSFEARHVPKVFWQSVFEERFRDLFEACQVRERTARLTLSVLLLELADRCSRAEALKALGIDSAAQGGIDRALLELRATGAAPAAFEQLHKVAKELSEAIERVDYKERAERFAWLTALHPMDWGFIAKRAGMDIGVSGREVNTAAFVWSLLTSGDMRDCPAFQIDGRYNARRAEGYTRFWSWSTEQLQPLLALYADFLLKGGTPGKFASWASPLKIKTVGVAPGYSFEIRHVPQVFWEDDYQEWFFPYFAELSIEDLTARRALSVLMAALVTALPRAQIADYLEFPSNFAGAGLSRAIELVRVGERKLAFDRALRDFAADFDAKQQFVNYTARRQALMEFVDIPQPVWRAIADSAGVEPGQPGGRSVHAAKWVWSYLTQGDYRLAPGTLQDPRAKVTIYQTYRAFRLKQLPQLREALTEYAEQLLSAKLNLASS